MSVMDLCKRTCRRITYIEDEIDPCELLKTLKQTSSEKTFAECVPSQELAVARFADLELMLVVFFDFRELIDQVWVVHLESPES